MIGFKASLCSSGDPCVAEAAEEAHLLHDFGDFELFKKVHPFMAGPVPMSLEFGCLIGLAVEWAVEGRMGVPKALPFEEKQFATELALDTRPKKMSFMLVGEIRPIIAGKVWGVC